MPTDLADKTIVITGANTGIGEVCARVLAERGATLILAGRSRDRHAAVLAAVEAHNPGRAHFVPLDLGSLASVRDAAAAINALDLPIHVLLNNAGLAGHQGQTADGFEVQFGVNHLGPFLLTELLLPRVIASGPARIVNVSSKAHYRAKALDWDAFTKPTDSVTGLPEYEVSKLCNVLHANELATRLPANVTTYSLHPGVVATDVWRRVPWGARHLMKLFMITVEDGAKTSIYCATDPSVANDTGRYYDNSREKKPNKLAFDVELARELDRRSREWSGL